MIKRILTFWPKDLKPGFKIMKRVSREGQKKFDKIKQLKRPMNAFLIFCKRQRGSVRRKYPFLENREVTRVLGEWWASLGNTDKSMYSALANQHKENLIRSHPEFKWYRYNMPWRGKKVPDISPPTIVPGKLADESQLGGLSSLLHNDKEPAIFQEEPKPPLPMPVKKRYRDEIYDFEEIKPVLIAEVKVEEKVEDELLIVADENNDGEDRLNVWKNHILEENNNVKEKHARACKGQRYKEFMWTTRRRSSRLGIKQDKIDGPPNKKIKTAKTEKTPTTKLDKISTNSTNSNEKPDISPRLAVLNSSTGKKPRKVTKAIKGKTVKTINNNSTTLISKNNSSEDVIRENGNYDTLINGDHTVTKAEGGDKSDDKTVVGSRKRKVRKQGIRRLEPGSTFKGVDVISENELGKLEN